MQLTIDDAEYRDRLAGHLRSVGFEVESFGRQKLDVLGLDGDAEEAAEVLEPFLRVWSRLYPDVDVEVAVRA
jgi:hypothetical protein